MVAYKGSITLNNSSSTRTKTGIPNVLTANVFRERDGKAAQTAAHLVVKSAPEGATPAKGAKFSGNTDINGQAKFGNVIFSKPGSYTFRLYAPSIRDDSDNDLQDKTFKVEESAPQEEESAPKVEAPPSLGGTIPPVQADESIGTPSKGGTQATITTPDGSLQTFDLTGIKDEIQAETQKALAEAQKVIDEARKNSEAATMTFLDELLTKGGEFFSGIADTLAGDIDSNLDSAKAVFDSITAGGLALVASMMDGLNKLFNPSFEDLVAYQVNVIKAQAEAGAQLGIRSAQ